MTLEQTLAQRQQQYGDYGIKCLTIQQLKEIIRHTDGWDTLRASQRESLEMIVHKIGRILHGDPDLHDSWHDIAGYATLIADDLEPNK